MSDKDILTDESLNSFGKEVDILFELFNSGLHHQPTKKKMEEALSNLAFWVLKVILISPEHTRRPYAAYSNEIKSFIERAALHETT